MKICWDIIEKIKFTKKGNFNINGNIVYEIESCLECNDSFLGKKHHKYCSYQCRDVSEKNRQKISAGNTGRRHSIDTKRKIGNSLRGENNGMYGRGYLQIGEKNPMYGRQQTKESNRKRRDALIGRIFSVEHRARLRQAGIGKCKSAKHIANIKASKKGAHIGKNNPNWKGGLSYEPYCEVWSDKEYKNWIKYDRDDGKCQNPACTKISKKLCLHHINYNKKDCRPRNLICICNSCNSIANKDRKWHEAWYNELIKRKYINITKEI